MNYLTHFFRNKLNKLLSIALAAMIVLLSAETGAVSASEIPEAVFKGVDNAGTLINNLRYTDVIKSNTWAKEAIYETGALSILKGYGNRRFGLKDSITREQAIAMVYRAVGREKDAQIAAEALNNSRQKQDKKVNPVSAWSDGYLQLAAADGLITTMDLNDAFNPDQGTLTSESFHRSAPASRQEMAYWLAKALKLEPVYDQQKIFNSFRDWEKTDVDKIPYIEPILQNRIMNGSGSGYFNPVSPLTKEQAAQTLMNAEQFIFPLLGLDKKTGTIEKISGFKDYTQGKGIAGSIFDVRSSNGGLHQITVQLPQKSSAGIRNENNGSTIPAEGRDLIVYKNGIIGKSSLLKPGDRIEYITAADGTVRFVKILSNINDTRYIAARINNIDNGNRLMNVIEYFELDYPDMDVSGRNISFDFHDNLINAAYRYSNTADVVINGRKSDISSLKPGMDTILTVSNKIVTAVKTLETSESGIVKGIVEDNNPQLGYITLYGEDGTGTEPGPQQLSVLRTYSYGNQNKLEVFKNHKKVQVGEIEAGDTVFLKLDEKLNVASISAVDNYTFKYARVLSKEPGTLIVEYDNGEQQVLRIDDKVLVVEGQKAVGYSKLKDGDRVRLLLHITSKFTNVKEIAIEGSERFITAIYKARVNFIDDMSGELAAQNLEVFDRGRWVKPERKGISILRLAEECMTYFDNREIDIRDVNKYLKGTEAYIAVVKDYGGEERAVFISYRNEEDAEDVPYDDSVAAAYSGKDEFSLSKSSERIKYGEGTIVVKDGRLVPGTSISEEDLAYVVANRSYGSGKYYAGIVQIGERSGADFVQIYRGRIKQIDEGKSLAVESYSQLKGNVWEYANTPKTFKLTYGTRIMDDAGMVNSREFTDYGDSSYKNRTVYIVSDGVNALLVSTAPYGSYNAKGVAYEITGGETGEDGTVLQQPAGLKITQAKIYDPAEHMWVNSKDMILNILKNSIILKDGRLAAPSDLRRGDRLRIIKKDESETGDGYIIIVEG